jgi:hypothetical protein
MKSVEDYFELVYPDRRKKLIQYHNYFIHFFNEAKGSVNKHQAWAGGYRDHLQQCLNIAEHLYELDFSFNFDSVIVVLYFHDIEKLFKYSSLDVNPDKVVYLKKTLFEVYGIEFTEEEINALTYIHGEGEDYCANRVMNELAAFCHSCDIISARCYHSKKQVSKRY